MTPEVRAALAARIKDAHDTAPRRDAWTAAADVAAREVDELTRYIDWLESHFEQAPDALRDMYAGIERVEA